MTRSCPDFAGLYVTEPSPFALVVVCKVAMRVSFGSLLYMRPPPGITCFVVIHWRSNTRTVTGRFGRTIPSVSTVTRSMRVFAPSLATYWDGWIPTYSDAGCTVTLVLPATT